MTEEGTKYRARIGHGTLYIMPEQMTAEEWLASVRPA